MMFEQVPISNNYIEDELKQLQDRYMLQNKLNIQHLSEINYVLQFLTNLDYVKEMLIGSNENKLAIDTVANNGKQMLDKISSISKFTNESIFHMDETRVNAKNSLSKFEKTFEIIEDSIAKTADIKDVMEVIIRDTNKIKALVENIKSVGMQTNILSLNASIEAARAGVNGRGFSIIAAEIKTLSSNTNKQVSNITESVESLNSKIDEAFEKLGSITESFSKSKTLINEAKHAVTEIETCMDFISNSFIDVSKNIKDQASFSQIILSDLIDINQNSNLLHVQISKTGQNLFELSQKIDTIRLSVTSNITNIDNKSLIKLAISDHLMWKWRVYNMILGYLKIDIKTIGNHHECRLGKWIDSLKTPTSSVKTVLSQIEKPHAKIHELARNSIELYNKGNTKGAEEILVGILENSNIVVSLLNKLLTMDV
jgi:methyl-accepting chemotaxis protein